MAALDFPNSPNVNDTHTNGGVIYTWDGVKWTAKGSDPGHVLKAGDTMTGNLTVPSLNSGQISGLRNQLINGGTYIWQRGTSAGPVAGGGYSADHVFISDGVTWTRVPSAAFAPGLEFGLRFSGGTNCYAAFPVELLSAGKPNQFTNGTQWTFSYYANRSTGQLTRVYFSDNPAPTNEVDLSPNSAPTPLGGNRYSVTFTVAAAPAGSNTCLCARVVNTNGAQLDITGAQLEPGPVATPYEQRPISAELAFCQRYFVNCGRMFGVLYKDPATTRMLMRDIAMRATPTSSITNVTGGPFTQGGSSSSSFWYATSTTVTASSSAFADVTLEAEL